MKLQRRTWSDLSMWPVRHQLKAGMFYSARNRDKEGDGCPKSSILKTCLWLVWSLHL